MREEDPVRMSRWQEFSNSLYRHMAQAAAGVLARSPLVESVYARRSVAAGEVSLGRSDIDLGVHLCGPGTGPDLVSLLERLRLLRVAIPLLGECQLYDPVDLRTSYYTDPYRASLDRRSGILLHGRPVEIPLVPIPTEQAAWRFAFWFEWYLPRAIRSGNRRNLRKFVLEMWNARATATGAIAEPFVRRQDIESAWRKDEDFPLERLPEDGRGLLRLCFEQAARLHEAIRPPLQPLSKPLVFSGLLPPAFESRQFVLIPGARSPLPPEASSRGAIVCTPEALDLYLHFANPFAWWILPESVQDLGIRRPSREAFVRACRMHGARFRIRSPGFETGTTRAAVGRVAVSLHALKSVYSGGTQPGMDPDAIQRVRKTPRSEKNYYRQIYPHILADSGRLLETLAHLGREAI
jgi:hypothetical protein